MTTTRDLRPATPLVRPAFLPAALLLLSFALPARALGASGERVEVPLAGRASLAQMEAADSAAARSRASVEPPAAAPVPMPAPPPREIGIAPAAPPGVTAPEASAAAPAPAAPVPAGTSLVAGTGFQGLGDSNTSIPPDTMGAVGPSHVVTMLNTQVRVQTKAGATLSTVSLSAFWTSGTGLSGSPFDPHVIYDSLSGRWIATADANSRSATSKVFFAISATSDPTGSWSFYSIAADSGGTNWADFPGLGVNSTWIAIANNMFTVAANVYSGAKMWVIDKSTALAGGSLTITSFAPGFDTSGGIDGFGLQPAITFDAAETTLYIIDNAGYTSSGTPLLRLSRITGTGPSPAWSAVPGSTFTSTGLFAVASANKFSTTSSIDGAQSGLASTCDGGTNDGLACSTGSDCPSGKCRRIDSGDDRIGAGPVLRNGKLWATHSGPLPATGTADRIAVFWYQLTPTSAASPIVQSGKIDGGAGVFHTYPSIAANSSNAAVLGFTRTDASRFAEAVWVGRSSSDAAGTMSAVTVGKAGEGPYYKTFSGTSNRWGDYSATSVDPTDDSTFWTLQEYAATNVGTGNGSGRFGAWWAQVLMATPTPTPAPTPTPDPTATPVPTATPTPVP
ncbi:hypothetical protein KGQ64_15105, partial [bacterium]|nr:hypothetical protein [bacterium]